MKICAKCGKEYDPANDFMSDSDAAFALFYFIEDTSNENLCGECSEKLIDRLQNVVFSFF